MRAMQNAIQTLDAQNFLILSENNEDPIRMGDKEIQIQSIPEWLLHRTS